MNDPSPLTQSMMIVSETVSLQCLNTREATDGNANVSPSGPTANGSTAATGGNVDGRRNLLRKTQKWRSINTVINSFKKKGKSIDNTTFFKDGIRQVDFVLVYEHGMPRAAPEADGKSRYVADKEKQRTFFEKNLINAGLHLEEDTHDIDHHPDDHDQRQGSATGEEGGANASTTVRRTTFVKIHAPFEILCMEAEKLKLKMPLKMRYWSEMDWPPGPPEEAESVFVQMGMVLAKLKRVFYKRIIADHSASVGTSEIGGEIHDCNSSFNAAISSGHSSNKPVTWTFSQKRIEIFELGDNPSATFFTPTQRVELVWNIIQQTRNDPEKRRGIERLLRKGIYEEAFAIHDGDCDGNGETGKTSVEYSCQREKLCRIWAGWKSIYRRQPLNLIRSYFGEKVGFYFAFLGFYTKMLVFPSIFGVCAFLYGIWNTSDDVIVNDICDGSSAPGNYIMCPLCEPPHCHFSALSDECEKAKWDYRMDHEATIVVACLIVIWSICMLKMWKRREAELAYHWDTYDVELEDDVIRPAYEERAPEKRRNTINREMEPFVPPLTKASWMLASIFITLLMLAAVGASLALLVLARIALYGAFSNVVHANVECARWFIHGLIFIMVWVFEKVYHSVADKLTSLECPRTQEAWISSFLWKVFIFELLNDFVPIAYAAWVKGRSVATPLELDWHSELCETGGCMDEVTELTAVLLLMRLVVGNAVEIGWPFAKNTYHRISQYQRESRSIQAPSSEPHNRTGSELANKFETKKSRWHADYLLNEPDLDGVAEEYLEMMIQFAFCTLFVPAFPLAPLICLVNNIFEIRVDAINFVRAKRRPLPIRVSGIHIWNQFLSIISKLAIVCNAGLIAFTSNIVPRLYYKYAVNPARTYENYTMFSFSIIHQNAWRKDEIKEAFQHHNITQCYYEDYRSDQYPYDRTQHWWEVTCVRLTAFSAFVLAGFTFDWLFSFLVDDTPSRVTVSVQRKKYFVTKVMEAEEEQCAKKSDDRECANFKTHSVMEKGTMCAGIMSSHG